MTNSKNLNTCKNCEQYYCMECSEANNWHDFCSEECEKEYNRRYNQ